jgi:hypothetical protein
VCNELPLADIASYILRNDVMPLRMRS